MDINVKGRYSSTKIKQKIEFQIQLPDFCSTKTVTAEALVDEETVGVHDIVLGQDFYTALGIIIDYKRRKIVWDDISIAMKEFSQNSDIQELSDDPGDKD